MFISRNKLAAGALLAVSCVWQVAPMASAQGYNFYSNPYANPYANPYYNSYYRPGVFSTHPILSSSLLGTAIGAAGGAAIGAMDKEPDGASHLGVGTAIGAGTGAALGAGVGMIRNRTMYGYWF